MPPLNEIAGWLLLGGSTLLLLSMALGQIWRHSREGRLHRQRLALLEEDLRRSRERRERESSLPAAWNGKRKFRVERKVLEGGDICSFYLTPHDGRFPLPIFHPGQFLTFDFDLKGRPEVRCYSLSDAWSETFYRVSIRRKPGGLISGHFHDQINVGDLLDVRAPSGDFYLDPRGTGGVVLSGSGVGVTPVLSMMKTLLAEHSRREIWFFYGVRNGEENIIRNELRAWASLGLPNVHLQVCHTKPSPGEEPGKDFDQVGRVTVDLFRKVLPSNNFDFFTCGPGPMMQDLREGLQSWGVPESRIHDEAFEQVVRRVAVESGTIEFKRSARTIAVGGTASSLLDLATKEGIRIPAGCRVGHCGTCQTALISGQIRYTKPPAFKVEDGCCLPCVCLPQGDVVIDA